MRFNMSEGQFIPSITFYYDTISPYSYLALELLRRYHKCYNFELILKPVYLQGIMKSSGNRPPFTVASKGMFKMKDIARVFNYYSLGHIVIPSKFPLNTINTQRVLTVIEQDYNSKLEDISLSLFQAYWQNDKRIDLNDVIVETLKAHGFDSEQIEIIIERSQKDEIKELLKNRTEEAVAKGSFGVPTFICKKDIHSDEELFFGSDRIDIMMKWMGFEPLPYNFSSKL